MARRGMALLGNAHRGAFTVLNRNWSHEYFPIPSVTFACVAALCPGRPRRGDRGLALNDVHRLRRQRTSRREAGACARAGSVHSGTDCRGPRSSTRAWMELAARTLEVGRPRLGMGTWSLGPAHRATDARGDRRTDLCCAVAGALLGPWPLGMASGYRWLDLGQGRVALLTSDARE